MIHQSLETMMKQMSEGEGKGYFIEVVYFLLLESANLFFLITVSLFSKIEQDKKLPAL